MSYPPPGPPYWPHPYPPPPTGSYPDYGSNPPPYWVPGAVMMPMPIAPMPMGPMPPPPYPTQTESQPTYITNYYYGEPPSTAASQNIGEQVQVVHTSGDFEWVPSTSTTAHMLQGRALIGGHEGWDGSPLWVIRAWHNGDLIPGKLSIRHCASSVMYDGKEIPVQNIEVLCAQPENLRWVPASNGMVPPGAIDGGRTANGEALYIGRAKYQLSLTPGKIHPSHRACYIGFAGREVTQKIYDVLCRIS